MVFGSEPSSPLLALALDSLSFALSIWTLAAGRRTFGPIFGKRTLNRTTIFAAPLLLSLFFAIVDFEIATHHLEK